MSLKFVRVAAAAAIAVSFVAGASYPVFAQIGAVQGAGSGDLPTYFDLGLDVTTLPQDPVQAKKFFAAQPPQTQEVLSASCARYLKYPMTAEMPETLKFCAAIQ